MDSVFSALLNGYSNSGYLVHAIYLFRIPVNKGTNPRLGWTKYSYLYEIVHPSIILISLCFLIGAECGKGLFTDPPSGPQRVTSKLAFWIADVKNKEISQIIKHSSRNKRSRWRNSVWKSLSVWIDFIYETGDWKVFCLQNWMQITSCVTSSSRHVHK